MQTDHALYCRFLAGETASYDELMVRYGDCLTYYLHGYLHDWQDAEDLMIEAFARIMVKKPKISDGRFKAYLFKTARNLALRFRVRKSRIQTFGLEELHQDLTGSALMEEKFQSDERHRALHRCMGRIDPAAREALWLVFFEDMSYSEAASVMGVNQKKIDNLLFRGKQVLKQELGKEGIHHAYE